MWRWYLLFATLVPVAAITFWDPETPPLAQRWASRLTPRPAGPACRIDAIAASWKPGDVPAPLADYAESLAELDAYRSFALRNRVELRLPTGTRGTSEIGGQQPPARVEVEGLRVVLVNEPRTHQTPIKLHLRIERMRNDRVLLDSSVRFTEGLPVIVKARPGDDEDLLLAFTCWAQTARRVPSS